MSIDDDITRSLSEEGKISNDPADPGGMTVFGISKKAHPEMFKNGPPTEAEARSFYAQKYVRGPGFDKVTDPNLQAQLIDYGINSGPMIAISKLQSILGVSVDGILGLNTLSSLSRSNQPKVNNQLVGARIKMFGNLVSNTPSQLKFLNGWLDRALSFMV